MLNNLLLLSGNDIPFVSAQIAIHQPTIKEIGYIGEQSFFSGCELLNFSKNKFLDQEDKVHLMNMNDFEVFMSIMNDARAQASKINAMMILSLLFPNYTIHFTSQIVLINNNDEKDIHYIKSDNFEEFKNIISSMFCLNSKKVKEQDYNPQGKMAKQIADKLRTNKAKIAKQKGTTIENISIFSRYISILAVGEHKNINDLMNYTVYQLYDEFERFELNQAYDFSFRARLAGATDIDDVDNWMKELHP